MRGGLGSFAIIWLSCVMRLDSGNGNENSKERTERTHTLFWTSLAVQGLRLSTPKAEGVSLIPGQGTKILYAAVAGRTTPKKH